MHINSNQRFIALRPVVRNTALSLLVLGASGCSDDQKPRDATETNLEQRAREVLEAHHTAGEFPGAVMALHDPKRGTSRVSIGTTTPDSDAVAVDPDVPWGIGSATKTFVAIVTLQLAEEELLDLDENIEAFFPELPRAAEITVRQLLQHTSGLAEYFESPAVEADLHRHWTPRELIDAAVALGPLNEPGAAHHYSNTNYQALGEIIADVTGNDWYEEVRQRILEPLDLRRTTVIGRSGAPPIAPGYGDVDGRFVDFTTREDPSVGEAAGGIQSTAGDLLRYARALRDGSLLSVSSQEAMEAFVAAAPQGHVTHEYGLGLETYTANELTLHGHLGASSAHSSFIGFEPESGIAVVVLVNVFDAGAAAFMALEVMAALTGKVIGPPAPTGAAGSSSSLPKARRSQP